MRPNARATAEVMAQVLRSTSSLAFSEGLNPAQWSALRYFAHAAGSARSVVAFARYHGTTKGTASQTIAALEKKGLVVRERSLQDRRTSSLIVTDSGRAALESDPINALAQAIAGLSDHHHRVMAEGLDQLLRVLLSDRRRPAQESDEEAHSENAAE